MKEVILVELRKITGNKTRVIQLKNILNKYRSKFYADDRMKMDLLLNSLEKNKKTYNIIKAKLFNIFLKNK